MDVPRRAGLERHVGGGGRQRGRRPALAVAPAVALGAWLGHRIHLEVPESSFRKLVSLALVAIGGPVWLTLLGFVLAGMGLAVIVPTAFREAGARSPGAPGMGVAAASTLGYLGFLAGPPLMGLLAEIGTLRLSFVALALAVLSVAWLVRRL